LEAILSKLPWTRLKLHPGQQRAADLRRRGEMTEHDHLETNRLILRELTFEDDAFVFELLNEPAYPFSSSAIKTWRSPEDAGSILPSVHSPAMPSTASVSGGWR